VCATEEDFDFLCREDEDEDEGGERMGAQVEDGQLAPAG
jgi:hypothetical protein